MGEDRLGTIKMSRSHSSRSNAGKGCAPPAPAPDDLIAGVAIPFAEAVSKLLGPKVEVVIHSLRTETVAHICNPFSKREVGDPSYMTEIDFRDDDSVLGPFERLNWDGRVIRSISAVLRNSEGHPVALACINFDLSDVRAAQNAISTLIGAPVSSGQPEALFKNDWHERMNHYIVAWCRERNLTIDGLPRSDRRDLIQAIERTDGFKEKHAASYIARVLGVSRATIYNDLKVRDDSAEL